MPRSSLSVIERVRDVAEEAYIFAFPLLVAYRAVHAISLDPASPRYRGPLNHITNESHTLGPSWRDVPSPNADTLLSIAALDLSAEPVLLSVPEVCDHYYVVQMVDLFGMNAHCVGTRTTGPNAGTYLLAGPNWNGRAPADVRAVLRFETDLGVLVARTELKDDADIAKVHALQEQYRLTPLSSHTKRRPPPATDESWMPWDEAASKDERFIGLLNFVLRHCTLTTPRDISLAQRWSAIGVSPGAPFDADTIDPQRRAAIRAGVEAARLRIATRVEHLADSVDGWQLADAFGNREFFAGDDLLRAAGAATGFSGADRAESYYAFGREDADGEPLDAKLHNYELRFSRPPPAHAFWSITMYDTTRDGSVGYLVDNAIDRYRVGSMCDHLVIENGALTITISHDPPERTANWLPAPKGPFYVVLRMYVPDATALDGTWMPPPITKCQPR